MHLGGYGSNHYNYDMFPELDDAVESDSDDDDYDGPIFRPPTPPLGDLNLR